MKHLVSDSVSDDLVEAADIAYRDVLARHALGNLSMQEVDCAKATLQSRGCGDADTRDIQFQAAITRQEGRKDLSSKTIEGVLHELLNAEYECDQAEWERDCHRRALMSHSNFKQPAFKPVQEK